MEPSKEIKSEAMKFTGKNVSIGRNVKIGKNVRIGDNTVIYDNVVIEDDCIISNDCILGEPLNSFYFDDSYENPTLTIGKGALIRSHCIIYAGSNLGDNLSCGHRVTIRENTQTGICCQFGSYNDIQGHCILGDYVRCQSYVNIGQFSKIGNYVFLYPFVVLTNDPTPPSDVELGVTIGDFSVISSATTMLPGAILGKHCLTAANSAVGETYEDYSFIGGTPGHKICDVRKAPFFNAITKKRHYPWPFNFKRNMPWANSGYEKWLKLNAKMNGEKEI